MIFPLRQLHRRMVMILGIVMPVALAVAVGERKPIPKVPELPTVLAPAPFKFDEIVWSQKQLFPKEAIHGEILKETKAARRYAVQFSIPKDFLQPDLLVYWVRGGDMILQDLPNDAILLGGFGSIPLPLSDEVIQSAGAFVLYSLADNKIVDVSDPVNIYTVTR
jgi:hypothetical protein